MLDQSRMCLLFDALISPSSVLKLSVQDYIRQRVWVCVCVCVCVVCTRARVRAQSCPILWEPMDCRPPGSSVHGIFQAKILEWVAIFSYARESSGTRDRTASLVSPALAGGLYHCTIWAKGQIIFPLGFKVLEYYQKFSVHQDDKVNI